MIHVGPETELARRKCSPIPECKVPMNNPMWSPIPVIPAARTVPESAYHSAIPMSLHHSDTHPLPLRISSRRVLNRNRGWWRRWGRNLRLWRRSNGRRNDAPTSTAAERIIPNTDLPDRRGQMDPSPSDQSTSAVYSAHTHTHSTIADQSDPPRIKRVRAQEPPLCRAHVSGIEEIKIRFHIPVLSRKLRHRLSPARHECIYSRSRRAHRGFHS
jgi:hypothetical protein